MTCSACAYWNGGRESVWIDCNISFGLIHNFHPVYRNISIEEAVNARLYHNKYNSRQSPPAIWHFTSVLRNAASGLTYSVQYSECFCKICSRLLRNFCYNWTNRQWLELNVFSRSLIWNGYYFPQTPFFFQICVSQKITLSAREGMPYTTIRIWMFQCSPPIRWCTPTGLQ